MASAVIRLPPEQLDRALAHYRAAVAAKRARAALGLAILAAALVLAGIAGEVDLQKFLANIDRLPTYVWNLIPALSWKTLDADIAEWFWDIKGWLSLLLDTLLIAYVGTLMGAAGAFVLCFFASANLEKRNWVRIVSRRFLEFCRTVPELVFALLFVMAIGLGAMPGALALAIHSMGAVGRLFAEVGEHSDCQPVRRRTPR